MKGFLKPWQQVAGFCCFLLLRTNCHFRTSMAAMRRWVWFLTRVGNGKADKHWLNVVETFMDWLASVLQAPCTPVSAPSSGSPGLSKHQLFILSLHDLIYTGISSMDELQTGSLISSYTSLLLFEAHSSNVSDLVSADRNLCQENTELWGKKLCSAPQKSPRHHLHALYDIFFIAFLPQLKHLLSSLHLLHGPCSIEYTSFFLSREKTPFLYAVLHKIPLNVFREWEKRFLGVKPGYTEASK